MLMILILERLLERTLDNLSMLVRDSLRFIIKSKLSRNKTYSPRKFGKEIGGNRSETVVSVLMSASLIAGIASNHESH